MKKILLLAAWFFAAAILSLGLGAYPAVSGLFEGDPRALDVILYLRFPRFAVAFLVGTALSLSGAGLQTLLRNPLAEPFILGISAGSALGVLGALLLHLPAVSPLTIVLSFTGGTSTILLLYLLSGSGSRLDTTRLLLSGIIINSMFSALILLGLSSVHHQQLSSYVHWMMGNLRDVGMGYVFWMAPLVLVAAVPLFLISRPLNVLLMGEEVALSSGVPVERIKIAVFVICSLLTAVTVSFVGIIGFVGLIVPNLCRRMFGSGHGILFFSSIMVGGTCLVLADVLSRLLPGGELPIGAVTAMIGAPIFLTILRKTR